MKRPLSSDYKKQARLALNGHFGLISLAAFLLLICWFLALLLISRFFGSASHSVFALVSAVAVALIVKLLLYLVRAGLTRVSLRIARQQKEVPADITYAFKDQPDRYLVAGVVFTVVELLYVLPEMFYLFYAGINSKFEGILLVVWALAGAIFLVWFRVTYGFAFACLIDDPSLGGLDAVKKSAALTKGRRKDLFILKVSFIGWIIPALFSSLFGLIWIMPYYEVTNIFFYLDLTRNRA